MLLYIKHTDVLIVEKLHKKMKINTILKFQDENSGCNVKRHLAAFAIVLGKFKKKQIILIQSFGTWTVVLGYEMIDFFFLCFMNYLKTILIKELQYYIKDSRKLFKIQKIKSSEGN